MTSQHAPGGPSTDEHELSDLPSRGRVRQTKSKTRSKSVPAGIGEERARNNTNIASGSFLRMGNRRNLKRLSRRGSQLDGITEQEQADVNQEGQRERKKRNSQNEEPTEGSMHSPEESEYTLSAERSHRIDSDRWSETNTVVPRRNLTVLDVAALIFNKMVGTGIFTTPGAVLLYTKSKPVSLALWAIGGVFTSFFILIYLEFGSALPFNGGELIYLDELYPWPELLSTIVFSGFFLVLGNSYGNSVTFAKQVILASDPGYSKTTELDERLVRFIAIIVLSTVCLLHYFSNKFGLFLNKVFAFFKIILLITVSIAGMKASVKEGSGRSDFTEAHGGTKSGEALAAMVLIFYTYQGWENANYVAGEIRAPTRTLKIGAFLAVGIVTILYVLVTLAYYLACDYETITNTQTDLGVAILFAPRAFGSSLGLKICIALSAVGNLIAVIFTSSKVKQAIAVQRILPFYKFFSKDIDTPKGALVLHWLSSMILILICPTNSDGYSFAVGLFTYGHIIIGTFVTIGLYRLPKRMRQTWPDWQPEIITNKVVRRVLPMIFAGGNLVVVIWGAKPRAPGQIPRYWWPVIFFLIVAGSIIYWGVMMITRIEIHKQGDECEVSHTEGETCTVGSYIGFEVRIYNESDEEVPEAMEDAIVQSRLDGSRRRVAYKFSKGFEAIRIFSRSTGGYLGNFFF